MKTQFPTLKTKQLLLRQFTDNDLQKVFEGLSHPDVIKYYGVSFDNLEATREQMAWFADLEKNETGIWWAICSSDNTIFYGAGGLNNLKREYKKSEIGFWLLPAFWGQGITTEAIPAICDYAFGPLGLHRIEGFVERENKNCHAVMSKLGFVLEGTMKDCELKNERYISLDIYAKFSGNTFIANP